MLYANAVQVPALGMGSSQPRKAQGVAHANNGAAKVPGGPAWAKGQSGHRAQGQLRDVKHGRNKVRGEQLERKGRPTQHAEG